MVNANAFLSKRRRNAGNPSASSSRRQPPKSPEGGSQPLQAKGVPASSGGADQASDQDTTPQPKRSRSAGSEVGHKKEKPLCPHLLTIESSKDLWHHPDLGSEVSRHNVREADLTYLRSRSPDELVDSAYCNLARVRAVLHTLATRARYYEDARSRNKELEEQCWDLTREVTQLRLDRDSTRKQLEKELSGVREELKAEVLSGRRYLKTLGGQRFLKSYGEDVLSQFKESMEFKAHRDGVIAEFRESTEFVDAVEKASVSVFDDCLAFCRERLVNSGRFPGEKFEFLDPNWVEMIEASPIKNLDAP